MPAGIADGVNSPSVGMLRVSFLVISFAPLLLPSYAFTLAFVTHSSVVQRAIEKLAEQVHQLQLSVQFHGAIRQTFALNEGAHVLPGGGDGPEEVAIGHALLGATHAQLSVT